MLRLVVCLYSLKGTCPLSIPGPWRIDCVLIGDRSPKCFKVVSLKAGQVRQISGSERMTEVGEESMIFRDISLLVAARLKSMPLVGGRVSRSVVSLVRVVRSNDSAEDLYREAIALVYSCCGIETQSLVIPGCLFSGCLLWLPRLFPPSQFSPIHDGWAISPSMMAGLLAHP